MEGRISIIVPVYNAITYLPQCLQSISEQTYDHLDIILVDDGSSDGSGEFCEKYARTDERIRVFRQKNMGVSAARNVGLQYAAGDYICFIDSDDYLEPGMMENLIPLMQDADVGICNFYMDYKNKQKLFYPGVFTREYTGLGGIREILAAEGQGVFLGHLWHKLFRRELLTGLSFHNSLSVHEDVLFVIQAFLRAKKIRYTSYPGYHYVQRRGSAMYGRFSDKSFTAIEAARAICREIRETSVDMIDLGRVFYIRANIKQASLCVYHGGSIRYLNKIRNNLKEVEELKPALIKLSRKERIYYRLLTRGIGRFRLFYRIFIKPGRKRYEQRTQWDLF